VEVNRNLHWIDGGKRLLFTSERDGWRHLYAISRQGDARLITNAPFDMVALAAVDEPAGWVYFMASPENATQRYLYRARLDGSKTERVTPANEPGTHTYDISPDCHWAFHSVSTFDSPGQSDLVSLPEHQLVRVINDNASLKAKVAPILAGRTEMVHIPVGHDTTLDGWLIRPAKFDPSKKYPIIINVYGEPAGSTVTDSWGGNNRLLMAALADDGYLVGSFDNSGTPAPKGTHWRKVIYGSVAWLGGHASLCGSDARRRIRLERRGIDDVEPDVPPSRTLQCRRGRSAGGGPDTLRFHLPGALHGAAHGQCEGLSRRLADQLRRRAEGQVADHPRHRG
jgi:dipeptidyl-peptidase-4